MEIIDSNVVSFDENKSKKQTVGRPKKKEPYDTVISFKVSARKKEFYKLLAENSNKTLTEYIRNLLEESTKANSVDIKDNLCERI